MALEIRELIIRAVFDKEGRNLDSEQPLANAPDQIERIVEECVQQVLKIMRRKEER